MTLNFEQLRTTAAGGGLALEISRLEEQRASRRKAFIAATTTAAHVRELAE